MIRTLLRPPLVMAFTRYPISSGVKIGACFFTSDARLKLRAIMEEYRQANYSQTLPSRFIKTVLNAADENHNGMVSVEEVEHLLENIGASDKMSREEIGEVMVELGCSTCGDDPKDGVPVELIQKIYMENRK